MTTPAADGSQQILTPSGFDEFRLDTHSLRIANLNLPPCWTQHSDEVLVHRATLSAGARMVAHLDPHTMHIGIYKLRAGRFMHVEGDWDDLGGVTLGGGLWEAVVDADSEGHMILLQGELGRRLLKIARGIAGQDPEPAQPGMDSFVLAPSQATRQLSLLIGEALDSQDAAQIRRLTAELPRLVEQLLPQIHPLSAMLPKPRSQRRVMALQYEKRIWDSLPLRGSMPDVDRQTCEALGLSRRSLQLAVQEHFGLSSNALQRTIRLAYANMLLSDPQGARNVTDAALAAGFSHLGRFSQQYRELFGETPSRTLAATLG